MDNTNNSESSITIEIKNDSNSSESSINNSQESEIKDVISSSKKVEDSSISEKKTSDNDEKFEFVTETIKKKPVNKKKVAKKVASSVLFGLLTGIVACGVIVFLAPRLYNYFYPDVPNEITIPEDELYEPISYPEEDESQETTVNIEKADNSSEVIGDEAEGGTVEKTNENGSDDSVTDQDKESEEDENIVSSGDAETKDENPEAQAGNDSQEAKGDDTSKEGETENDAEKTTTIINNIVEKSFELDDYKQIYRKMSEVANKASSSIVMVTSVSDGTDWFMNSYETGNQTAGIILADNGKELLIITNNHGLLDARDIDVTFNNGIAVNGVIKKTDKETGLSVVAVNIDDIPERVKRAITMAKLGNSTISATTGTPVLAIGAPLGISDSIATGLITSNKRVVDFTDSNLNYITTDIYGSTSGSGVLIDLEGRVLGIIFQGTVGNDTKNLVHAYAISDIKSMLEKLSNGQDLAYLGIKGTDVTKQVNETLNVPMGAYITQVNVDSPAMKSGIQNGDVIVKLGTTEIASFKDYKDALLKCQPGDLMVVTVKRMGKDEYVELSYEVVLEGQP